MLWFRVDSTYRQRYFFICGCKRIVNQPARTPGSTRPQEAGKPLKNDISLTHFFIPFLSAVKSVFAHFAGLLPGTISRLFIRFCRTRRPPMNEAHVHSSTQVFSSYANQGGLRFTRRFSRQGISPYDEVQWEKRTASITDSKGNSI